MWGSGIGGDFCNQCNYKVQANNIKPSNKTWHDTITTPQIQLHNDQMQICNKSAPFNWNHGLGLTLQLGGLPNNQNERSSKTLHLANSWPPEPSFPRWTPRRITVTICLFGLACLSWRRRSSAKFLAFKSSLGWQKPTYVLQYRTSVRHGPRRTRLK